MKVVNVIREMQTQTTMKYHFTPTRMAIIKKTDNKNHWRGCGETATLIHGGRDVKCYSQFGKQSGSPSES